jgi:WD40 repeat protein
MKVGELPAPSGTKGAALHLVFSPDGKTLAADYSGEHIALWDAETQKQRALIQLSGVRMQMAFDAISAATDGQISLIAPVPRQQPTAAVQSGYIMAFTPDGSRLAVAWPDHQGLRLWDMKGEFPSETLRDVPGDVTALAFRRDGMGFVTSYTGGAVGRWTMAGKPVDEQMIHPSKGKVVWIGTDAATDRLFSVDEFGVRMGSYPGPNVNQEWIASFNSPSPISSASLSVEEDSIVTVDNSGAVRIWPAHWRAFLRESCNRLRDHIVFREPAYSEGLVKEVIERAHDFCAAQVWKQ